MSEVRLEREFDLPQEELFDFMTMPATLQRWWGPEAMDVPEHDLDFTRKGPWFSVMQNSEGQRYKVSGQVTHVNRPRSIGLTWAWHDDDDLRGQESHVTMTIEAAGAGTSRLTLVHVNLADEEVAANHRMGWTSSLEKLRKCLGEIQA